MNRRLIPLFLSLLFVAECGRERSDLHFEKAPVVLISIDTLRSDRLPIYGYSEVETPNIDALRADGVLCASVYSHCPMTLPSHISILTGLLPTEHQVRNNLGYIFDSTKHETLPQLLAKQGYATGAAVSSYVLRRDTGIASAFQFYDDAIPIAAAGAASEHQRSGYATLAIATKWLGEHTNDPFFFMFHIYEPHAPYDPPEPFKSRYADRYDGEIATADAIVGDFISYLKQTGVYDRAIVVLLSDHGEGLYQHGEDQHGILLYREALQVPLVIKLPKSARKGDAVTTQLGLADVFPTIASLLGVDVPETVKGVSAFANAPKGAGDRRIYSETFYPRIHLGWSELRSLIDRTHHYIQGPKPELYDRVADPGETKNALADQRRVAASMKKDLDAYPAGIQELGAIDPEDAAKLAALGYIGSAHSPAAEGPLPNPNDMLPYLDKIKAGFLLADQRRYSEAIAVLQKLVDENPDLQDAASKLGELLTSVGRYDDAIRVYRNTMARAQRFSPELALSLGDTLLRGGQLDEAAKYADLGMKSSPSGAHTLRARIAAARGDYRTAVSEATLAVGDHDPQPAVMLVLAEMKRSAGDLRGAYETLDAAGKRAKELGIDHLFKLDYVRGDVLARMDRPDEAVAAYQREIANFPGDTQAYANLAIIYFLEEQPAAMNQVLDQMAKANPHPGAYALAAHTLETLGETRGAAKWRATGSPLPGTAVGEKR